LPDSQINFNGVDQGDVVSVKTINVDLTDGVDPIVPTSVGLVGNTLTITLASSGDVDIEINGIPFDTIAAPATIDIPVINSVPVPVGTITGTDVVVGDATVNVRKSDATLISAVTVEAEGIASYGVADSTAVIKDSAGTTLKSEGILAATSENITINDSTAVIKDSIGTTLKTEPILAEASENITINNSTVNVRDTAANLLHAVSVRAEATTTQDIADTTVENSDASYSVNVLAEGSLTLPDSQINVNGVDEGDVVSVKTIDVNLEDSLGAPVVPTSVGLVGNTLTIEVPSSAPPTTGDYLVRFFDIDGTILKEEYVDAGNSATAPSTPTYDSTYLTFKEWNKTFSVINEDTDVGAIYDTIDGKTYLFLRITNVSGLQPTLQFNKSTTSLMTINWGDTTTDTTSTSGNINITKTAAYSAIGDYVVTIEDSGTHGVNTGGYILGNNVTYSSCLLVAYLGTNFTTISASSFRAHTALRIISLNDNITTINLFTFTDTNGLLSINLPNSITTFSSGFSTGLKTITIPLSITSLPSSVFNGCSSLVNVIIPSSINTLAGSTFVNCFSIRQVNLSHITSLGASIFSTASSLESVVLNNSVTSIQSTVFQNCTVLNSVNIPTSVTSVGAQAFLNCNNLKELEFPSTLTSIAAQAFQGCNSILEYTFLSTTPPTLAATSAFTGIKSTCKIYVPDANVAAYQAATNWSTYANYIYPLSTKP
jgi:hypothetical protein